jgi:hypothetical protein
MRFSIGSWTVTVEREPDTVLDLRDYPETGGTLGQREARARANAATPNKEEGPKSPSPAVGRVGR